MVATIVMPKSQKRREKKPNRVGPKVDLGVPPRINAALKVKHVFRFIAQSGIVDTPVYGYDMLGLNAIATSATGASSAIAAVKIHRVRGWCAGTTAQTVGINWQGPYAEPSLITNTAMGTAEPGRFDEAPPPGSAASFWVSYSERANVLFTLTGPTAMEVDVVCTVILNNATKLASIVTYVSSGLTAGLIYFGPLDKQTGAPKLLPAAPAVYYG